jgi:flagellar biosynthesis protein FlhG
MDQADSLRRMVASGHAEPPLRIIAVASGKGGVGKTSIAVGLAVHAARGGKRVLVIDGDLGLANVEVLLGAKPRYHLGDLFDGAIGIKDVLSTGPHGMRLLPASLGIQQLTRLDDAQKLHLITALDTIDEVFDIVVIDAGSGIGDNVLFFVGAAQEALLVVTPEPTSMVDAYATIKVLTQQAGVRRFRILVNQAHDEAQARDIFLKLTAVTDRFLNAAASYLGYLPPDDNVHRAIMAQKPLLDLFPRSTVSLALTTLADRLIESLSPATLDGGLKFLWERLFQQSMARG